MNTCHRLAVDEARALGWRLAGGAFVACGSEKEMAISIRSQSDRRPGPAAVLQRRR